MGKWSLSQQWPSWALRALLAVVAIWHVLRADWNSVAVAGVGIVLSLVPPAVGRFSGASPPRALDLAYTLAIALQFSSESLGMFEAYTYWDKVVHAAEILLATWIATFLALGYREQDSLQIPDNLMASWALFAGISLGTGWEFVEFASDWFLGTHLQVSNTDTVTDLLTNSLGAILGTVGGFLWYRHRSDPRERAAFGRIADWVTPQEAALLHRHGWQVGLAVVFVLLLVVAAGWIAGPHDGRPPGAAQ